MKLCYHKTKSTTTNPAHKKLAQTTWIFVIGLITWLNACSSISLQTPEGFVYYHKTATPYKAISADGIRLMISQRPNEPQGELESWHNVLLQEMKQKGYQKMEQGDTRSRKPSLAGKYTIFLHKYHGMDHAYLLALFVAEKKIILAEAAGPYTDFQKHKEKLIQALQTIEVQ